MKGLVSLVGSGPGDPGLLTLKAQECLRQADLIVYDYLANPDHLRHAQKNAVKIGVGKGFRHKLLSQEKINRLIISSAQKGKRVVRLKGGDPYLFGRGGEEALLLEKNKIPFEVVPGVTSATACAAYAGIPLTHRDHNSSITFLTGHRAQDDSLDSIPWKKIAGIGGTLVIYMGLYNLPKIAKHLILAGMPPATAVAVIQWGTLPQQRTVVAPLGDIALAVKKSKLGPPCIILIGDVVSLRNKLGWFEKLPLFGKKILITRAPDRAGSFRQQLTGLGAEAIEMPLIQIEEPPDFKKMDQAINDLKKGDWAVFASAYGVEAFFKRLHFLGLDTRYLAGIHIASVGTKTSAALLNHGVNTDLEPEQFESAAILRALKKGKKEIKNKKFILFRTNIAPPDLEQNLKKAGALVKPVTAYCTTTPSKISADLKKMVLRGEVDFAAFTSASTVEGFVKHFGAKSARKIALKTHFLSIGPVTSKALKSYGLTPYLQAKTFTVDGLLEALILDQTKKMKKKRKR